MTKQGDGWRAASRVNKMVSAVQLKMASDFPHVDIRLTTSRMFVYRKGELEPFVGFEKCSSGEWRHGDQHFTGPYKAAAWAVLMISRPDVSVRAQ